MGKNESQARNAKVEKEVTQKVLKSFGETNPSKAAKAVAQSNTVGASRNGRETQRR